MNDKDKGNAHIALGGYSLLFGLLDLTKASAMRLTEKVKPLLSPRQSRGITCFI